MGDKSPKSKKRDQSQKAVAKAQEVTSAKTKQDRNNRAVAATPVQKSKKG